MSFKAVQASIEKKEGVSAKSAGAILASQTRKASPAARKANPKLNRVKGASRGKRHMHIEENDDGTLTSRTREEAPPRKGNQPYREDPEFKATHPTPEHAAAHVKRMFARSPQAKSTPAPAPEWAGVANQMLGSTKEA